MRNLAREIIECVDTSLTLLQVVKEFDKAVMKHKGKKVREKVAYVTGWAIHKVRHALLRCSAGLDHPLLPHLELLQYRFYSQQAQKLQQQDPARYSQYEADLRLLRVGWIAPCRVCVMYIIH